jgi:hypothetical protein
MIKLNWIIEKIKKWKKFDFKKIIFKLIIKYNNKTNKNFYFKKKDYLI